MFTQESLFGPRILTVSAVTQYLRALLESDEILRDVWVSGEISTLSTPSSGHIYFTLKDGSASLRCVIWRAQAMRLRGKLQSGAAVEVHGAFSVYEAGGQYQLYVDTIRMGGEGQLFQEFMRLKAQLEAEGLFDSDRKRPFPEFPTRIGIVTSPTGAALQDMLNTLQSRFPLAEVLLAATMVQGQEAPAKIVQALQSLNAIGDLDVILLARGGGSLEDLWAFNDERVVRAIVASRVPVVTGVGHETDITLADFAADLRAPTPTAAAVLATPDRQDLLRHLYALNATLVDAFEDHLQDKERILHQVEQRLNSFSPVGRIRNDRQRLDELAQRLTSNQQHSLLLLRSRLEGRQQQLQSLNPLQVLQRGFAVVRNDQGRLLKETKGLQSGDRVNVRLAYGEFDASVTEINTEN